jgi:hypothetical protein
MITSAGLNSMATAVKNLIAGGTYTIGGVTKDIPIVSTAINANTLVVQLYLDDSVAGTVTKFQLKGYDGTILADRPDNVVKTSLKGLLVIFTIVIQEV